MIAALNADPEKFKSVNEGLISTDRGTKTTLMRTIPRSILSRIQRICLFKYLLELLSPTAPSLSGGGRTVLSYDHRPKPKVIVITSEKQRIVTFSLDSGLEAFSRNPAHGSFSALTFQSTDLPIM